MSVPLDVVTSISRHVIAQLRGDLELLGVVSTDGGSDRVELLVTIAGCHREPCPLALNVTRGNAAGFEEDLRRQLRDAVIAHDK